MMRYGFGYGDYGLFGFGGIMMGLFMVLILVIAVLGTLALIRYLKRTAPLPDKQKPEDKALEILSERYARGEISDDEYAIKRATLLKT